MKFAARLFAALVLVAGTNAFAALPFSDPFLGTPNVGWTEWFNTGGSLTVVTTDTDWRSVTINPPAGSDGSFGKSTFNAPTYATHGWLAGEATDTNYTVEAKIFVPQVSGTAEPDDYLYQQLIAYAKPGVQYIRMHSQYNLDTFNRVRVQFAPGSFAKTVSQADVFSGGDGWHTFKAVLHDNTQGEFYVDSTLISGATIDWSVEAASLIDGQFGFGQFIDGTGQRSVYVDAFSAYTGSGVADWTQFE